MALSVLIALIACPAFLGTQEAIRQSQSKSRKDEHRATRCNMMVTCLSPSTRSLELNNRSVVLRNSKLFIDTGTQSDEATGSEQGGSKPHKFAGYFLPYPDANFEGLVSTITDEAPILNWIYVDKDTYEVKYGVRTSAQPNLTGPFDCTREDRRMTFKGWEGFAAVEEDPGVWALYFDLDDDGLRGKLSPGVRVLDVELVRREKKIGKPEPGEAETLAEMMRKQQLKDAQKTPAPEPPINSSTEG